VHAIDVKDQVFQNVIFGRIGILPVVLYGSEKTGYDYYLLDVPGIRYDEA